MGEITTVVDFIAKGRTAGEWKMVLVEQGPWNGDVKSQLLRLQDRLYGCVDAALDGKLAEQFPESKGKKIVIRLDCYNLPEAQVAEFFDTFSEGVLDIPDYRDALKKIKLCEAYFLRDKF